MCRMQAMQEQLPAAARVLTPAGRRWRSKMLRILSNSAGDLWTFTLRHNKKGPREDGGLFCYGGERGIRTPGPFRVNGFQDRRIRPLCQLSFDTLWGL